MASVAVVEPWYGGSHRAWLDGWRGHSRHDIELITLPDRFWRWRMRGGAVETARRLSDLVDQGRSFDAVVLSSLLDAATFTGLARRSLARTPVALYMHENQLLYPAAPGQRSNDDFGLTNWKSMVAVDAIWWNSAFHRDALLDALPTLLARQPEAVDPAHVGLRGRSHTVLWPGVALQDLVGADKPQNPVPVIIWNQRWDHDKNPRAVVAALVAMAGLGLDFEVILAGENQGHGAEFDWATQVLGDRVRQRGYLPSAEYRRALLAGDVVVSAADHEFFGIAIVEALAAGAVPVLPDRLSFPELVADFGQAALYREGDLRVMLERVLTDLAAARRTVEGLRGSMLRFDVVATSRAHDDAVDRLIYGYGAPPAA